MNVAAKRRETSWEDVCISLMSLACQTRWEYATCSVKDEVRNCRNLTFWITLQCFSFLNKKQTMCFQGIPDSLGWYLVWILKYVISTAGWRSISFKSERLASAARSSYIFLWILILGMAVFLSDSPTLGEFILRPLQMDPCWAFDDWALAQKRRLKNNLFHHPMKVKRDIFEEQSVISLNGIGPNLQH